MPVESLDAWQRKLARISQTGIGDALGKALARVALDVEAEAKLNATTRLRVRTGALRRSIRARVRGTTLILQAGGGSGRSDVKYAAAQEYGKTITPKGRFLARPVGPALTPAGAARYTSARQVPGLHFVRVKAGRASGVLLDAKGTIWYVLYRRVRIEGKRYLRDAMKTGRGKLPGEISKALRAEILGTVTL